MSSYEIYLRETWKPSSIFSTSPPVSEWTWTVEHEGTLVDSGTAEYGGSVGEERARKEAEAAATLHARRTNAKFISYDFSPDI